MEKYFFTLCFVGFLSELFAQPSLVWKSYANYGYNDEYTAEMLVDQNHECILVVNSHNEPMNDNILIYKLNVDGAEIWNYYSSSGDEIDDAILMPNASIAICGQLEPSEYNDPGLTLVLDSIGTLLWLDTVGSVGRCLAIDSSSVYTAYSDIGVMLKKYSLSGDSIFSLRIDSFTAQNTVVSRQMIADKYGQIYIVGYVGDGNLDIEYFLKKVTSDGEVLWDARYNPTSDSDYPYFTAIDSTSNVYIYGSADNVKGVSIVKIDAEGNIKWDTILANNVVIHSWGLSVNKKNETTIAGFAMQNSILTYFIHKFDSLGNQLWSHTLDTLSDLVYEGACITEDDLGGIYMSTSGKGIGDDPADILITKFDTDGNILWKERFSSDDRSYDIPRQILLDDDFNIYVTGETFDSLTNSRDIITLKYSQTVGVNAIDNSVKQLNVHPNPFHNSADLHLYQFSQSKSAQLELYDLSGKLLQSFDVTGQSSKTVSRDGLPNGMYLLQLKQVNQIVGTAKIVVQ